MKDVGSRYGIYIGERAIVTSQNNSEEDRLNVGEEQKMFANQHVRFGLLKSKFKLKKKKLNICVSSLVGKDLADVKKLVSSLGLGVELANQWSDDVTHLVVSKDNCKMTMKVSNALANMVPIVDKTYLRDLLQCVRSQQYLPDEKNYVPRLKEANMDPTGSLASNPDRRTVFRKKRLLFVNSDQLVKYNTAIQYAGGTAEVFRHQTVNKSTDVMIAPSTGSVTSEAWKKAEVTYRELELVPVLESQIAWAILFASCDNHCNPSKKYQLLATQDSSTQGSRASTLATATQDTLLMSNSSSKSKTYKPKEIGFYRFCTLSVISTPVTPEPSKSTIGTQRSKVANWLEKSKETEAMSKTSQLAPTQFSTLSKTIGLKSQDTTQGADISTFPSATQQSRVYNSSKKLENAENYQKESFFNPQVTSTQKSRVYDPPKKMQKTGGVQKENNSATPKAGSSGLSNFRFQKLFANDDYPKKKLNVFSEIENETPKGSEVEKNHRTEKRKRSGGDNEFASLPSKKKHSMESREKQRDIFEDEDDDLFNFEFEEEKAPPKKVVDTANKAQVVETTKINETLVESAAEKKKNNFVDDTKVVKMKRKLSGDSAMPAKRQNCTKTSTTWLSKSTGFLNTTHSTTKSYVEETLDIPKEELSRSYTSIKRKPLIVRPKNCDSSSSDGKMGKNVKLFKKQRLSKTTTRIVRSTRTLSDFGSGVTATNTEPSVSTARAEKEEEDDDDPFGFISQAM